MKKRKSPQQNIGLSEWQNLVDQSVGQATDAVPPGWYSAEQIGLKLGRPSVTLRRTLRMLAKVNKVLRKQFRISETGRSCLVWHYRMPDLNVFKKD